MSLSFPKREAYDVGRQAAEFSRTQTEAQKPEVQQENPEAKDQSIMDLGKDKLQELYEILSERAPKQILNLSSEAASRALNAVLKSRLGVSL